MNLTAEHIKTFWKFVEEASWKKDHNYARTSHVFQENSEEDRNIIVDVFNEKCQELEVKFGEKITNVGDDGWSDIRADVIGRGESFFNSMTQKKMQELADTLDYEESFSYSFH
jgi:hypothetical protein